MLQSPLVFLYIPRANEVSLFFKMSIAFHVSIGIDRASRRPSALRPFGRFYPRPRPGARVHMSFFTTDPKTCQTTNSGPQPALPGRVALRVTRLRRVFDVRSY